MASLNVDLVSALNRSLIDSIKDETADLLEDRMRDRVQAGNFLPLKNPNKPWWHRPLNLTGALLRSIYADYDERAVYVYSDLDYSGFHQYGTSTIPARKFIYIDAADAAAIEKIWLKYER